MKTVPGKFRAAVAAAALTLLTACAGMSGIGSQAHLADAAALGLPEGQTLAPAAQWWSALGDPQLDALVAQALEGNPSLRAAAARVVKAQSAIGMARADGLPQIEGELDAQRMRFQENYIYPPPYGGSQFNMGTLQLNGRWELDFFGKHSGAIAAAVGQARAAEAEADAARVLLAANVVRAYVQWARIEDQRAVAARMLAQRQHMLQLVHERRQAGLDTQMEVRQSETGRADSRTQITALEQQADAARNALAALLGQPRLADGIAAPRLAGFKTLALPDELMADWLGRRADIVAARWRVEAARGGVQAAQSLFYPNINLVGAIGLQSLGFGNWIKSGSLEWNAGPAISLPIFEGGRLRANLRGQTAELDAAIEDYNAAVIQAMRDVADQVQAVQSLDIQRTQQAQALAAAEGAYAIAQERYRAGLSAYLNVLIAETTVLAQRRQQVDLAAQSLNAQIGLAQAMGGGWQPTAEQAALPQATTAAAH
ncbi:MAG: efflux transporter outer membrane subunit [Burkholderiaceae bacterium]|jgi:NodT family efflux transporter outer membrane factor (OMF) lipoprotein|nr:efflux transporter outer membrane subunit [Burkholderiaceae bacterium]